MNQVHNPLLAKEAEQIRQTEKLQIFSYGYKSIFRQVWTGGNLPEK